MLVEELAESLLAWAQANFILIFQIESRIFDIPDFGRLYMLVPIEHKLFDDELMILFDEEQTMEFEYVRDAVEKKQFDYFVFCFGEQWYYCKPALKKDGFNEMRFSIDFTDLKYVGKNTLSSTSILNNLAIHTEYDMLNGNGLKNYMKKAKFFGCTHVGMCDKNTMAATLAWQTEALKAGLRPVLGETITVAVDYKQGQTEIPVTYELKLYVTDWQGWQNLLQINKRINVDYPKFIPEEELMQFQEGLICIAGFESYLNFHDEEKMLQWLGNFLNFEQLYFQVDCSEFYAPADDARRLTALRDYFTSQYVDVMPPIMLNDVYYCDKEQYIVRDYLNKVAKRAWDYSEDQYFKSFEETLLQFTALFANEATGLELFVKAVESTNEVCQKCGSFEIETGRRKFPTYEYAPTGMTNMEYFHFLIAQGFEEKVIKANRDVQLYWERVQKELVVIEEGGLVDYLLIVLDPINFCRTNNIFVGPGRGSVVGCVIAWLIGITSFPPIEYDLLFERFLDETRTKPKIFYEIEISGGNKITISQEKYLELALKEGDEIDIKKIIE